MLSLQNHSRDHGIRLQGSSAARKKDFTNSGHFVTELLSSPSLLMIALLARSRTEPLTELLGRREGRGPMGDEDSGPITAPDSSGLH